MDEQTPSIQLDNRTPGRECIIASLLIFVLTILAFFMCFYFGFNPRDRVAIAVSDMPIDNRLVCIIVETDQGPCVLDYFQNSVFTFRIPAAEAARLDEGITDREVAWVFAERYGVVTRNADKAWHVTWFHADEIPLEGRSLLFGGGSVRFDLLKGKSEVFPPAAIRELGLEAIR